MAEGDHHHHHHGNLDALFNSPYHTDSPSTPDDRLFEAYAYGAYNNHDEAYGMINNNNPLESQLDRLRITGPPAYGHMRMRAQSAARAHQNPGLGFYNVDPRYPNGYSSNGSYTPVGRANSNPVLGYGPNSPVRASFNGGLDAYLYNSGRTNSGRSSGFNASSASFRPRLDYNGGGGGGGLDLAYGGIGSSSSSRSSTRRSGFTSLNDLRGKIYLVAKDQYGCRFLQNKFKEGNPEDIHMIFCEVKDHVCELMIDQFGNYLIQRFFEVCNEDQMTQLVCLVINDERKFKDICNDMYGTRAVQKLIEHVTTQEQSSLVISVLRRITFALVKNMNGHHVIQHCFRYFSVDDTKHIVNVLADNCLDISSDKNGCCVVQHCLPFAQGEPRDRLVAQITSNALILSEHPYGNYVVQFIIGLGNTPAKAEIIAQLSGNYVSLAMNKYGSNVVEHCLKESQGDEPNRIAEEIMRSSNFLRVLQDPYGNYVAQSVLSAATGAVQQTMVKLVHANYPFLHSNPHGKRVLARAKLIKRHD